MTRPARSRVRHGMASCARYGCTRPECHAAYRRVTNENRRNVRSGIPNVVDVAPALAHARRLVTAGMPAQDIADRSGISSTTIRRLLAGAYRNIYRVTAEAILGIPLPDRRYSPVSEGLVPAVAARRRLQALSARGFTLAVIATELGVSIETISALRTGRRTRLRVTFDQAVAALYDRWWNADPLAHGVTPHGQAAAITHARSRKWAPPAAWDDDEIADPAARPFGVRTTP